MNRALAALAALYALAFLGLLGYATHRVSKVESQLEAIFGGPRIMTLTSTWKDASNITHTVSTPREDGWTREKWIEEHKATVLALKAEFPPA